MHRLLIVDDDTAMGAAMLASFEREGYDCELVTDGAAAVAEATRKEYDLVLLDVVLPRLDGLQVCEQLRKSRRRLGIIMVSALGGELNSVAGLRFGADDYVTKPFAFPELLVRVEAVLRRTAPDKRRPTRYRFADVEVDFRAMTAQRNSRHLELTPQQLIVLRYFLERQGLIVTRQEILRVVSPDMGGAARSVDTIVWNIRRQIESDPSRPRHIVTVYGGGYRFVAEAEAVEEATV